MRTPNADTRVAFGVFFYLNYHLDANNHPCYFFIISGQPPIPKQTEGPTDAL
jgi:hypothetical protein